MTAKDVEDHAETLSFPSSVLEYFQGYLGQPPYGFPEPLRSRILDAKRLPRITGRPGATLKPLDLEQLGNELRDKYDRFSITDVDILSAALYPKVFLFEPLNSYHDRSLMSIEHLKKDLAISQFFQQSTF